MKIGIRQSLAVTVLALLGAGCADEPQQAGPPAAQPAKVAAAPAAANSDDPVECEDQVSTGTMIPKKTCVTASQKALQEQQAQSFLELTAHQNH